MTATTLTASGPTAPITPPTDAGGFAGTIVVVAFLGLSMGAMLGGAALGIVRTDEPAPRANVTAIRMIVGPPPPMIAALANDEDAPDDDDFDLLDDLFPLPSAPADSRPRMGRGPSRNALDSAFYRVEPGPVTGYRDGHSFTCTVTLVDGKPVEVHTATAFERMRAAAARAGLALRVMSGFRTMEHQRALYAAFRAGRGNLAALPGHSNHQSGHALDLNVTVPGMLRWLNQHALEFGFRRTVPTETWHWEHW